MSSNSSVGMALLYTINLDRYLRFPTATHEIVFVSHERDPWFIGGIPADVVEAVTPIRFNVSDSDVEQWRDTGLPADLIARLDNPIHYEVEKAVVQDYVRPFVNRMSYVPSTDIATRYVHRKLSGVVDFAVFDWARQHRKNILLYGPTGAGKTMAPEAYAATHGLHMAMVSGNVAMTPHQILGGLVWNGSEWVWQDGIATEVVRHGGLLDLDELNFIPSKVATVLFPLLAGQRHITLLDNNGETVKAHDDLVIFATMNPGYAGTLDLNAALRNRFTIQRHWGYDDDVEAQLVPSQHLRDLAKGLRAAEAREEISTPTPTNALMDFAMLATDLGMDFAIDTFVDRYSDDEQAKVKLAVDANRMDIERELIGDTDPEDPETPEYTVGDDDLRALADLDLNNV